MMLDKLMQHGIGIIGSNIKSIQHFQLGTTDDGDTINIESVDVNKTVIISNGQKNTPANYADEAATGLELIDSTTILVHKEARGTSNMAFTVVEFKEIKSFQRGVIVGSDIVNFANIESVNPIKSLVFVTCTHNRHYSAGVYYGGWIESDNTIGLCAYQGSRATFYWQVIEFN